MKEGKMTGALALYKEWLATATAEQIAFVDQVYAVCEKHYQDGGDVVLECFTPAEVLEKFKTLEEVREYCGLKVEQALNARWGEDDDPQVARADRFEKNWRK
jgi:hypothetical protein